MQQANGEGIPPSATWPYNTQEFYQAALEEETLLQLEHSGLLEWILRGDQNINQLWYRSQGVGLDEEAGWPRNSQAFYQRRLEQEVWESYGHLERIHRRSQGLDIPVDAEWPLNQPAYYRRELAEAMTALGAPMPIIDLHQ